MAKIVSKLNLNKTPNLVDNNSLVFAKNIKLLSDGTIGRDDGISKINIDSANMVTKITADIAELQAKKANYESILTALIGEQEAYSPTEVIKNYIKERTNNLEDLTSIVLPTVGIGTDEQFLDTDLYDLYDIYRGDGSYEYPEDFYDWDEDWAETANLPFSVGEQGNRRFEVENTTEFLQLLNNINNSSLIATDLKIPVFPSYFYEFINDKISTSPNDRYNEVKDFDYNLWLNALTNLKTNEPDFYNNVFTEIPDTRALHAELCCHQHGSMIYYFNWFLYNHGIDITTLLKAAAEQGYGSDLQYRIDYYRTEIAKLEKTIQGLTNIKTVLPDSGSGSYSIVGIIPYNTSFYMFIHDSVNSNSFILEYSEKNKTAYFCDVKWTWSGGVITGNCTVNLKGQRILNVAEYNTDSTYIPFKSINLDTASYSLDESVYTQTPKIPMTNLILNSFYTKQIPNGTYQFFIRYRISDDVYTNWFPATTLVYTGNHFKKATVGGIVRYTDTNVDSSNSFVFTVQHLNDDALNNYKDFQVGFILTNDNQVVARSWKHFEKTTDTIYFDYDKEFIKEIDITDLTNVNYGIFNVKNVISFKNKLYISNYVETNFNPNFNGYAEDVRVTLYTVDRRASYSSSKFTIGETAYTITLEQNTYTGVYYMRSININSEDVYVEDIITSINTRSTILNKLTSGGEIGDTVSETDRGITATLRIANKVSNASTNYKYMWNVSYYTGRLDYNASASTLVDDVSPYLSYISLSTGYSCSDAFGDRNDLEIVMFDGEYRYNIVISYNINLDNIDLHETNAANVTTLLPGQSYKFFIHYVKETGEITNGFPINNGTAVTVGLETYAADIKNHYIIYPEFSNISVPSGYNYYFFSIAHIDGFTAEIFKLGTKTFYVQDSTAVNKIVGHCMEFDAKLISILDNIPCSFITTGNTVINSIGNTYHPSYDSDDQVFMGGTGCLNLNVEDISSISTAFVTLAQTRNIDDISLIKCTPMISGENSSYNDYTKMNLLGFICDIVKPVTNRINANDYYDSHYVSGSDVYSKSWIKPNGTVIPKLVEDDSVQSNISAVCEFTVYSNYNMNFLSLNYTLQDIFVTRSESSINNKYLICAPNSLEVSDLYKLEDMYKEPTQKYYAQYDDLSINKFDNTVRSSNVLGDESSNMMYKFGPTDYYNIPTSKGIIINLVSIGNYILVHTEDSMFKFSGNNTLSANGGEEVAMQESEVFDTGVTEVFGSEFGYAGIQNRLESITLPELYVFYDSDAKEIYAYSGQGQIIKLSDPIQKLLKFREIRYVRLAGDYFNNRVFIHIQYVNGYKATLSYNFNSKSFISLHDFSYVRSFNTKTKCYFIQDDEIYYIDNSVIGYNDLEMIGYTKDLLYPSYTIDGLSAAIVDVLVKDNIETVKTLNNVKWIASEVLSFAYTQGGENYITDISESTKHEDGYVNPTRRAAPLIPDEDISDANLDNLLMAEEMQNKDYCGDKIRIYSDLCATTLLDISKRSNDYGIDNPKSYECPRFNQGYWSFNYFRDVKNIKDIFNYIINTPIDNRTVAQRTSDAATIYQRRNTSYPQVSDNTTDATRLNYSDNHSLVEGRYFVVRFIFDTNKEFKLENVSLNYNEKL